ncbi:hypothetical protein ALC53_12125 [Atta colombica]|uniref:Uncharacterized protein n=1 Tax=Atta colombica TaxID=520822 RepID=A0A195AZ65_9HYME|nr:hypothetical protein ALC53_12125 [Atta colombica]
MTIRNLHKWPLRSFPFLLHLSCLLFRCSSFLLTSFYSLYVCFLRVVELPGQWHEGGPSFLTVCMIFPRGPLALLPPTVPS